MKKLLILLSLSAILISGCSSTKYIYVGMPLVKVHKPLPKTKVRTDKAGDKLIRQFRINESTMIERELRTNAFREKFCKSHECLPLGGL